LKRLFRIMAVFGLVLAGASQAQTQVPSFPMGGETPSSCASGAAEPVWLKARPSDKATCSAHCANGSMVSATCGGTCMAVDFSCPQNNGFVVCNGVRTDCIGPCKSGASCEATNGTSCPYQGATLPCRTADGSQNTCNCWGFGGTLAWSCPY
jgi:hypothetical protein